MWVVEYWKFVYPPRKCVQLPEMELQELLEPSRQCSSCGSRFVEMAMCSGTILCWTCIHAEQFPIATEYGRISTGLPKWVAAIVIF